MTTNRQKPLDNAPEIIFNFYETMKLQKPLTSLIIHHLPNNLATLHRQIGGDKSAIWKTLKRLEERGCVAQGLNKEWMYLKGYDLTEIEQEVEGYYALQQMKQGREKNGQDNVPENLKAQDSEGRPFYDLISFHLQAATDRYEPKSKEWFNENQEQWKEFLATVYYLHQNR